MSRTRHGENNPDWMDNDEPKHLMTTSEQTLKRKLHEILCEADQNRRIREFNPQRPVRQSYQSLLSKMQPQAQKQEEEHPIILYSYSQLSNIVDDFRISPIAWTSAGILVAEKNTLHFQQSLKHQTKTLQVSHSHESSIFAVHLNSNSSALVATNEMVYRTDLGQLANTQLDQFNGIPVKNFCQLQHPEIIGYAANSPSSTSYTDLRTRLQLTLKTDSNTGGNASKTISNQHRLVATAFNSHNCSTVVIWDLRNPQNELGIFRKHKTTVKGMAFHPTNKNVIATSSGLDDPSIYVWNAQRGEVHNKVTTSAQITSLHWRNNRSLVATHGYSHNPEQPCLVSAWILDGNTMTCTDTVKDNARDGNLRIIDSAINPEQEKICTVRNNHGIEFFKINKTKVKPKREHAFASSMHSVIR